MAKKKREKMLAFTVSSKEKAIISEKATSLDMTLSDYCRYILFQENKEVQE